MTKNEPHGKANDAARANGMIPLIKITGVMRQRHGRKILEVNPNALILVEVLRFILLGTHLCRASIGYPVITNYHGAWWGEISGC